jgi:heat shock protein 5
LDSNSDAEKEEYDEKRKEIEEICDPIIKKSVDSKGASEDEEEDFDDEF